jgi:hypothetical protein
MQQEEILSTINKIWPNINGQVTGYFSSSIFNKVRDNPTNETEVSILFVTISMFYILMEPYVRKMVIYLQTMNTNKVWKDTVNEYMNVVYRFFIFVIVQYITIILNRDASTGFRNVGIIQQIAEAIIVTFILIAFVTVLRTMDELFTSTGEVGYVPESVSNFVQAYDGIYGVIVQFFATSFFATISENVPDTVTASALSLSFFVFYLTTEYLARLLIDYFDPMQIRRPIWDKTLNEYLDFMFTFSIFFIIQYIGLFISDEISGNRGVLEELVVVFTIFIVMFSIMRLIVELTKYNEPRDLWFITDTTKRIWPKINGTCVGLISTIITDRLFTTTGEREFLLYLILLLVMYTMFDSFVRKIIDKVEELRTRSQLWFSVVEEIMDFFFSLGLLLFLSAITNELSSIEGTNLFQTIVTIISLQLVLSSVLVWFKSMDVKGKED